MDKIQMTGWASAVLSIWFLSGIIIVFCGVLGMYLGRTYEEVKKRPLYIVDEICQLSPCQKSGDHAAA